MRKYALVFLPLVLLLGGCGFFNPQFRDQQGRALDHPYGDEKAIIKVVAEQSYHEPVAISVDGGQAYVYEPGQVITYKMTSKKIFYIRVWWGDMIGYDGKLKEESHPRVGLWTGKPIIIDEAFLRDVAMIKIVICNESTEMTDYSDSQGHHFTLAPLAWTVLNVADGGYRLIWHPAGNYQGESIRGCKFLVPGKKVFWNGQFYDDRLFNNRSTPNQEDLYQMRRYDCIPL